MFSESPGTRALEVPPARRRGWLRSAFERPRDVSEPEQEVRSVALRQARQGVVDTCEELSVHNRRSGV